MSEADRQRETEQDRDKRKKRGKRQEREARERAVPVGILPCAIILYSIINLINIINGTYSVYQA